MIRKRRFNLHDTTDSGDTSAKKVIFLQYEMPPLKTGEYTINVRQDVNLNIGTPYSATRKFAVTGQRFTLDPLDFNAVFPPELANGEFMGTLPLVTFNRRTLPWERSSVESDSSAPWLALLLFNEGETPDIQKLTVKDLVPVTETIAMPNSDVITLGAMPVTA
ncbi:MAG: hypothetical protein ACTHJ0_00885, partial [Flavipsychrobacter sp.]